MTAVGVLCPRVRVEEKQIIAAIDQRGLVAVPVPPAGTPLPPGPASTDSAMLGELLDATTGERMDAAVSLVVDRAANRSVAATTLPLLQAQGIVTLDAGLAATGTRVQVASALNVAGIPRPRTLVGFSEASAVAAVTRIGCPATLLGLSPGSSTTPLLDADTADAVIEHRVVLGSDADAVVLLQAGTPHDEQRSIVHVVGRLAIAVNGAPVSMEDLTLAESVARVIGASLVSVELVRFESGTVVWDVHPVADFRSARLLETTTVADAIAELVKTRMPVESVPMVGSREPIAIEGGERHGLALSA